jgi:hypothetical protein
MMDASPLGLASCSVTSHARPRRNGTAQKEEEEEEEMREVL